MTCWRGGASHTAAAAVANGCDAHAHDGEALTDVDRHQRAADPNRLHGKRRGELQQADVGGGAVREHALRVKLRMRGHALDIKEARRLALVVHHLGGDAGCDAVRGGQDDIARDQRAGAG